MLGRCLPILPADPVNHSCKGFSRRLCLTLPGFKSLNWIFSDKKRQKQRLRLERGLRQGDRARCLGPGHYSADQKPGIWRAAGLPDDAATLIGTIWPDAALAGLEIEINRLCANAATLPARIIADSKMQKKGFERFGRIKAKVFGQIN